MLRWDGVWKYCFRTGTADREIDEVEDELADELVDEKMTWKSGMAEVVW